MALTLGAWCTACSLAGDAKGDEPDGAGATFHDLNGVMWFYTTANDMRFDQLASELDEWKARGVRIIGIYSPYNGDKEQWLGAAPKDFYDVPPQNGTLDDFRGLVQAAHDRNMKVIAFMGFHSIDEQSTFFSTAEAQYAAGDRSSPEVSAFHWTTDPSIPTPSPVPVGPSEWKRSEVAGAYYWALWGNAGLDVNLPGAAVEIRRAIEFWMDVGLDGFMLDSGIPHQDFSPLWVDLPLGHKDDLWLTFESTGVWDARQYDDFGLTAWFAFEDNDYANTYTRVVFPEVGEPAIGSDGLEEELRAVDWARERGRLTHAWSILEREYADDRMRVQEAALLAGAGIMYGAPMMICSYQRWPAQVQADWDRVLVTVNANPALLPSGSRVRAPAGPDSLSYAMVRTSEDGSQMALLVFNFRNEPVSVTVDLGGLGIALEQTPTDLYRGGAATPITGPGYTVQLDAYGFAILEVAAAR